MSAVNILCYPIGFINNNSFIDILTLCQNLNFDVSDTVLDNINVIVFYRLEEMQVTRDTCFISNIEVILFPPITVQL